MIGRTRVGQCVCVGCTECGSIIICTSLYIIERYIAKTIEVGWRRETIGGGTRFQSDAMIFDVLLHTFIMLKSSSRGIIRIEG